MWLALATVIMVIFDLDQAVMVGPDPVTVDLMAPAAEALRPRIDEVARDPKRRLVLLLGKVSPVSTEPGSWEVYSDTGTSSRTLIGVISSYGVTASTQFALPIDAAIRAHPLRAWRISFVPALGRSQSAAAGPSMSIGEISLATEGGASSAQ